MPNETILILDNENHSRWILKTFLESEQYPVVAVDTVERALRNFLEFEVSAFITEYWINQSSTTEAIRELKTRFPECYVMILTDKQLKENAYEELMAAGVDDCFLKPLSARKILLHLQRGLKRRRGLIEGGQVVNQMDKTRTVDDVLRSETPHLGKLALNKVSAS